MEELDINNIYDKIKQLLEIINELEIQYHGRKFTLDGHLFGSIGEVLAQYYYGIDLSKPSTKTHDGEVDGRKVQIKITQIDSVDIKEVPDYLIVLFLKKDEPAIYEVYNGPGNIAIGETKKNKNNEYNRSLSKLSMRDKEVDDEDRIQAIRNIEKWNKGIRN